MEKSLRVLVLIWHPYGQEIRAGGFVRTQETLNRFSEKTRLYVIEPEPPLIEKRSGIVRHLFNYPRSFAYLERHFFVLERLLEIWITMRRFWLEGSELLKSGRVDAIYVPSSELYWTVWPAYRLSKRYGVPLILCNQNVEWRSRWSTLVKHRLLRTHRNADLVITVSKHLERLLIAQKVSSKKIAVNTNGIDLDLYVPNPGASFRYDACFIGRHVPEKGIFDLLQIWQAVGSPRKAKLVMAGQVDEPTRKALEREIAKRGLRDLVTIRGAVSQSEKIKLYQDSRFFLFPSIIEGWGLVPQEAMACGRPVIAYHLPAYNENIAVTHAAVLVKIGDWRSMSHLVAQWLDNPEEVDRRAVLGRPFVSQFGWPTIAKREEELIRRTVNQTETSH